MTTKPFSRPKPVIVDTIVYLLIGKGGGVDGRDHTDKPGQIVGAYLTRSEAEHHHQVSYTESYTDIKPEVMNMEKIKKEALAKLNPVEQLAIYWTNRLT